MINERAVPVSSDASFALAKEAYSHDRFVLLRLVLSRRLAGVRADGRIHAR